MRRLPRTLVAYGISLVLMALVTAFKFNSFPPQIPMLYSLPDSDSQVVDIWYLAFIPLLSFLAINVNNFLAKKVFKREQFILRIVYVADLMIIGFFTYIFIKIVFLIT